MGFFWESLSFLRRRLYNRFFLSAVDLAAVVVCSMIAALTFYRINNGVFRLFGLIGLVSGLALVRFTLGYYIRCWERSRGRGRD